MKEGIKNIFSGLFSGDFLLVLAKIIGLFTLVLIAGKSLMGLVGIFKTITIAASGFFYRFMDFYNRHCEWYMGNFNSGI